MKNNIRQNRGITLIALVITIIVLLILVGITIASLTGENGILSRASESRDSQNKAQVQEELQLIVMESITEQNGYVASEVATKIQGATVSGNQISGTYKGYSYTIDENGKVTVEDESNPPAGGTGLKVGDTDLSTVSDISTMYGETTSYKSTSHPNIDWQLFYADSSNYYVIASDYVPTSELPCNGNSINEVMYGNEDLQAVDTVSNSEYKARFASSNSYNDYVMTNGTEYKKGSQANTLKSGETNRNPIVSTYLKWVDNYPNSSNVNICAVAYMLDINKWSSFADGADDAFAMGGPTVEMFTKSYNAVSSHTIKLGEYDDTSDTEKWTSSGYKVKTLNGSWNYWGDSLNSKTLGETTDMWCIHETIRASGYWLASPSSNDPDRLCTIRDIGNINFKYAYDGNTYGFRPLVAIPKS